MLIGIAIPAALLVLVGHPELTMYAVFGAFAGMYGRAEPHQLRLFHQLGAAVFLVGCVTLGVTMSLLHVGTWTLVGVETALAGIGSLLADRLRLRPVGPFFGLFAFGACAAAPVATLPWVPSFVAVVAATSAIIVGFSGWIRHRQWTPGARRHESAVLRVPSPHEALHAGRYVIAVGAAGAVATLCGLGHPYWAMASAAVPLAAADLPGGIRRGVDRILGTYAGLVLAGLVLVWSPPAAVLVLIVVAFQFPTELFITRHYALALVFFTPLILVMTDLAHPGDPATMVVDRGVETTIGAIVGIVVAVVTTRRTGRRSMQTPPTRPLP